MSTLNRREFFAAGAVATAFSSGAMAQPNFPSEDPGKLHRDALERAMKFTNGVPAASEEGLNRLVTQLLEMRLISKSDADSLRQLIKELHAADDLDAIVTAINKALERKAGELTTTIIRIARSSLDWSKEKLKNLNPKKVRYVIAHDTSGALQGAAAGATLGATFAGLGAGPGAIMGAIVGSSATSLIAVDDFEEKK